MDVETNRNIPFARQDSYLRAASVRTESARQPVDHEEANQERFRAMKRATLIGVGAIFSAECLFRIVELAFRLFQ
jgi:hypothetical protein